MIKQFQESTNVVEHISRAGGIRVLHLFIRSYGAICSPFFKCRGGATPRSTEQLANTICLLMQACFVKIRQDDRLEVLLSSQATMMAELGVF